jgi:hypothetical protein
MPASSIHSFSLQSWGPLEKDTNGDAVFVDAGLVSAEYIANINKAGKKTVCYIDAGTLESWRTDKEEFVISTDNKLAKKYKGFGGSEQWFDITKWEQIKAPMTARIQNAASKGCYAVELDNTDCYGNMCVPGYSYDQLLSYEKEYTSWLFAEVHSHNMAAGIKNSQELFPTLENVADFAINEQCMDFNECGLYKPFTSSNRVVFNVEYNNHGGKVCSEAAEYHLVTKYEDGSDSWKNC